MRRYGELYLPCSSRGLCGYLPTCQFFPFCQSTSSLFFFCLRFSLCFLRFMSLFSAFNVSDCSFLHRCRQWPLWTRAQTALQSAASALPFTFPSLSSLPVLSSLSSLTASTKASTSVSASASASASVSASAVSSVLPLDVDLAKVKRIETALKSLFDVTWRMFFFFLSLFLIIFSLVAFCFRFAMWPCLSFHQTPHVPPACTDARCGG